MPCYQQRGELPAKRHTAFRRPDGGLYAEHLMGTLGFDGPASLLYHIHRPTQILSSRPLDHNQIDEAADESVRMRHFRTAELKEVSSATLERTPLLFNRDVVVSIVRPQKTDEFFFRNGQTNLFSD